MKKILKKDMATWDLDVANKDRAKSVENPPLRTAGAMFSIINNTFSSEMKESINRLYLERRYRIKYLLSHGQWENHAQYEHKSPHTTQR